MDNIPIPLINTFISAGAIIIGTLLGAYCTWIITLKNTRIHLSEQKKILYENISYDKEYQRKKLCEYANIIRLDICTAIYQSLRAVKRHDEGVEAHLIIIPINERYSTVIAPLSSRYKLEELSYIYQLYAAIESINKVILYGLGNDGDIKHRLIKSYLLFLERLYGDEVEKVAALNLESISYYELYNLKEIDEKYRSILLKLDRLCGEKLKKNK